jgi:hypothetical protein
MLRVRVLSVNDLRAMPTIYVTCYMILWPDCLGAWLDRVMCVVCPLSGLELLRGVRKKACFPLARRGDRGAGFAPPPPRPHLDPLTF